MTMKTYSEKGQVSLFFTLPTFRTGRVGGWGLYWGRNLMGDVKDSRKILLLLLLILLL